MKMGILNNLPTLKLRRSFKDSGTLILKNTSEIASGGTLHFTLDARFKPYDDVTIINLNSSNDCSIVINGNIHQPLPRGNKCNIDHNFVSRITITNNGSSSISVGEIEIYYRHTGEREVKSLSSGLSALGNLSLIRGFFR